MKKKLNSLSDLSTIKFDNLSPDKEDIIDPIEEEFEKLHFELHFSKKGRSGKIVTLVKGVDIDKYIRLIMLCNDITLRNLIPPELHKGFGFFVSKPATAFSPFAVTPDELGEYWQNGRLFQRMRTTYNDALFGNVDAGPEMYFSFRDIIEHICQTRSFCAGTIVGSGTISNKDSRRGSSCLSEKRMLEKINEGVVKTPYMKGGDRIQIEVLDQNGHSIFGQIDQVVSQQLAAK